MAQYEQLVVPASVRKGAVIDIEKYRNHEKGELPSMVECAAAGKLEYVALQIVMGNLDSVTETEQFGERGTPVHHAARNGHLLVVDFLVEHGAGINSRSDPSNTTSDHGNQTPLMWTVRNPHLSLDAIYALLDRGADLSLTDSNGRSALTYALEKPLFAHSLNVRGAPVHADDLLYAAKNGFKTGLQYLIENHKLTIDVNTASERFNGSTALHEAARNGHFDCVNVLMFAGADGSIADNTGKTAGDVAATSSIKKIIQAGVNKYEESHANFWILKKPEKMKRFLLAGILPNTALVIAALYLPAVFGFVVLVLNLYGVQLATKAAAKSRDPEPSLAGWYSGALVFGSTILVTVVFPEVDAPIMKAVWWIVTSLMFACYVRAVTCDPGVVVGSKNGRKEFFDVVQRGGNPERMDFCPTTLCKKPHRAKFCSTSLKLVQRFDHYCVWTANTIGSGNHRPFFFFTVLQTISQSLVLAFAIKFTDLTSQPTYAICPLLDFLFNSRNSIVTYFFLFYNFAVIIFIGAVFSTQFWYISRNVTSNEVWFPDRYQWCFNLGSRTYTLYDQGFVKNWTNFLFGDLEERGGAGLPVMDGNPHLTSVVKKYQEKAAKEQQQQQQQCKKGCCEAPNDHQAASMFVPQQAASSSSPQQQSSPPEEVKVASGGSNLVDEETGFIYPVQLKDHIMKMPLETRQLMAAKQKQVFQQHNLIDTETKTLSLPPKDQQDKFLEDTKTSQALSQRFVPQQESVVETKQSAEEPVVGGGGGGAVVSGEEAQPDIHSTSVVRSSSRTTAKIRSSTQNRAGGE